MDRVTSRGVSGATVSHAEAEPALATVATACTRLRTVRSGGRPIRKIRARFKNRPSRGLDSLVSIVTEMWSRGGRYPTRG